MRPFATLILLLLLFSSNIILAQSSANATEKVNVPMNCSFALTMHSQPVYQKLQNITIYYTLSQNVSSCTINTMNGSVVITQLPSSNIVLTQNLTAMAVNSTPQTSLVSFRSDNLTNSTYAATVAFRFNGFSNSSTADFTLLNPQNLSIIGISDPFVAVRGAPITFQINTTNLGQLSAGNFTLFLNITGLDSPFAVSAQYPGASLLPFQNTTFTITIPNVTPSLGGYDIQAFETYPQGNGNATSNIASTLYSVIAQTGVGGGVFPQSPNYITSLPSLLITSAPLVTSVTSGIPSLSILGLQNTGSRQEIVKFSIPQEYQDFLSLSTNVLYIQPNQQASVQLFVSANATAFPPGTYVVPLNIDLNFSGKYDTQTEYFSFTIYPPQQTGVGVVNQVTITNNTNTSRGILQINNPTSTVITNMTLHTLIPLAAAQNASDIVTTGLPATLSEPAGFYTINWQIPQINPSTTLYAYYVINRPTSQKFLQQIQNVLAVPSSPSSSSILKVVNIAFPTFYTNSSDKIKIFTLFTGTSSQPVTFTLTAPSGIKVENFTQTINAQPNQLISPSFNVTAGASQGTYLLNLFITTKGFSANYTLPLIVLNSGGGSGPISPGLPFYTFNIDGVKLPAIVPILIIAIAGTGIIFLRRYLSRPKYKRETSEQLVRLREQIKRSENE